MDILIGMSVVSVVGMVVEKIAFECGKVTHAQYASITSSSLLGLTALRAVAELIKFLGTF